MKLLRRISTKQKCQHPVVTYGGKVGPCNTPIHSFIKGTEEVKCLNCLRPVVLKKGKR